MNLAADPDHVAKLQHLREACLTYVALTLANTVDYEQEHDPGEPMSDEDRTLLATSLHVVAQAGHAYVEARRAKRN